MRTFILLLSTWSILLVVVSGLSSDAASLEWNTKFPTPTRRWVNPTSGNDRSDCGTAPTLPCQSVGFTLQDTLSSVNNVTIGFLTDGLAIELQDGIYLGAANRMINFARISLRLYSVNGPTRVIFDGEGLDRFIHMDTSTLTPTLTASSPIAYSVVEGITFFNGLGDRSGAVLMRGNLVNFGNRVIYNNCRFAANIALYLGASPTPPQTGGAVLVESVVLPNSASSISTTKYFHLSLPISTLEEHGPLFDSNSLTSPTGLHRYSASVIFRFCHFERNDLIAPNTIPSPSRRVGVLSNVGSYLEMSDCLVTNQSSLQYSFQFNTFTRGATAFRRMNFTDSSSKLMALNYLDTGATHAFVMESCRISRVGSQTPAALLTNPALIVCGTNNVNVTITNTIFEYNLLPSLMVVAGNTPMFRVYDSIFRYNELIAPQFILSTSSWLVVRSKFIGNMNSLAGVGSGTVIGGKASKYMVQFDDCDFDANLVPVAGGVFDLTSAPVGSRLYLRNSRFTNNFAGKSGGAIQVFSTTAMASIIGCNFTSNSAFIEGGAMLINSGNVHVENSIFDSNIAPSGGGIKLPQAASDTSFTIGQTTFIRNEAIQGGAISIIPGAVGIIHNSTFILNKATNGGAVYMSNPPSIIWTGVNEFDENFASSKGGALFIPAPLAPLLAMPNRLITVSTDVDHGSTSSSCTSPFLGTMTFRLNRAGLIGGAIMADGSGVSCLELDICAAGAALSSAPFASPTFVQGKCQFDSNIAEREYGKDLGYEPVAAKVERFYNGVDDEWVAQSASTTVSSFTAYPGSPLFVSVAVVDPLNRPYGVTGSAVVGVSSSLALATNDTGILSGSSLDAVSQSVIQVIRDGYFHFSDISLHGAPGTSHSLMITFDVSSIASSLVLNITLDNCPSGTQFESDEMNTVKSMSCVPCKAGSYNENGRGECALCKPETYSDAGATTCTPCPSGMRSLESGSDSCYEIPPPVLYALSSTVRNVVWACAAVTLSFILGCGGFVGYYWNSPVIRAASRPFLVVLLIYLGMLPLGSLLYAAVPDLSDASGESICIGRAWLSAFPLSGVLVVMLVKNWRLMTIFLATNLSAQKQSDGDLAVAMTVVQALMAVMLSVYSALPLSQPQLVVIKGEIGRGLIQTVVAECSQEHGFSIWMGVCIGFIALLMILNAILAFRTRNLPTQFNEASHMTFALMLLMLFGVIIVPIAFLLVDPSASIIIQGLGQTVLAGVMTCCIFAPKIYHIMQIRPDGKTIGEANNKTMIDNGSAMDLKSSSNGELGPTPSGGGVKSTFSGTAKSLTPAASTIPGRISTITSRIQSTGRRPLPQTRNPNLTVTDINSTLANETTGAHSPMTPTIGSNVSRSTDPAPAWNRSAESPATVTLHDIAPVEVVLPVAALLPVPISPEGQAPPMSSSLMNHHPRRIRVHWTNPNVSPGTFAASNRLIEVLVASSSNIAAVDADAEAEAPITPAYTNATNETI